jgi:hypothetical protein
MVKFLILDNLIFIYYFFSCKKEFIEYRYKVVKIFKIFDNAG